jgi:8-oxo-dGTP pyrophosphatase MutT (NUDIX family)
VAAFDLALPRKRMASRVLLFDVSDRVLAVEPTYVDFMELPGGSVDLDESPRQAAIREVKEELGLDRDPGRLLAMDWFPPRPGRSEGLIAVFDGGRLTAEEIAVFICRLTSFARMRFSPRRRPRRPCRTCWRDDCCRAWMPGRRRSRSTWKRLADGLILIHRQQVSARS